MQIIDNTENLAALTERLAKKNYVTIDTEFMRESTYWPDLCLIQIASDDEEAIIDPLAGKSVKKGASKKPHMDLTPLYRLLDNKQVVKVFHAARQDIEIFHHLSGVIPAPLFDTQVAAMVCGFGEQVSYSMLVKKMTNQDLDKSSRFTDWSKRPLSDKQLKYAMGDVTHLRDIYKKLTQDLDRTGRAAWLGEEMRTLTSVETYHTEPDEAWKRMKMRVKSRRALGILVELAAWRENLAQRANQPRGRILKDDALYDIANQAPETEKALSNLRTVSDNFARSDKGAEILKAVKTGLSKTIEEIPPLKKGTPLDAESLAICELLRVLLKATAAEHNVAPKMIATAPDLEKLALSDEADIPALKGWRFELFGQKALRIKQGELVLTVKNNKVRAIEP